MQVFTPQSTEEALGMHNVFFLSCLLSSVLSLADFGDSEDYNIIDLPPLLNVTDNECSGSQECIPQESCKYFQEDLARLEELHIESEEYKELMAAVQKLVCNKEERGFCCSLIDTQSIIGGPAEKCCR